MRLFDNTRETDTSEQDRQKARTTIGITKVTKDKLDRNRAPGQCYEGFICQLIDLWESNNHAQFQW